MIMESVFHSDCYRDEILDRNCIFTRKYIEIRESFKAYRLPPPRPRVPTKAFALYVFTYFAQYMKVACWHTGAVGGGGGVVYGPKSNDRAGKNAVYF